MLRNSYFMEDTDRVIVALEAQSGRASDASLASSSLPPTIKSILIDSSFDRKGWNKRHRSLNDSIGGLDEEKFVRFGRFDHDYSSEGFLPYYFYTGRMYESCRQSPHAVPCPLLMRAPTQISDKWSWL